MDEGKSMCEVRTTLLKLFHLFGYLGILAFLTGPHENIGCNGWYQRTMHEQEHGRRDLDVQHFGILNSEHQNDMN